ncbi:hypothetical protein MAR_017314, partial [Mya arenaria]
VESTGKTVATTLTSVLWYMDGRHDRFESRAVALPDMFKDLRGYRSFKEQHQKCPEENIDKLGDLLLLPWILNLKFSKFKAAIDDLLRGLQKYHNFLKSAPKRTKQNHDHPKPVKNLNESWVLKVCESTQREVNRTYEHLKERLRTVRMYEPIDMCDLESLDKENRRKWLSEMTLHFPVTCFT